MISEVQDLKVNGRIIFNDNTTQDTSASDVIHKCSKLERNTTTGTLNLLQDKLILNNEITTPLIRSDNFRLQTLTFLNDLDENGFPTNQTQSFTNTFKDNLISAKQKIDDISPSIIDVPNKRIRLENFFVQNSGTPPGGTKNQNLIELGRYKIATETGTEIFQIHQPTNSCFIQNLVNDGAINLLVRDSAGTNIFGLQLIAASGIRLNTNTTLASGFNFTCEPSTICNLRDTNITGNINQISGTSSLQDTSIANLNVTNSFTSLGNFSVNQGEINLLNIGVEGSINLDDSANIRMLPSTDPNNLGGIITQDTTNGGTSGTINPGASRQNQLIRTNIRQYTNAGNTGTLLPGLQVIDLADGSFKSQGLLVCPIITTGGYTPLAQAGDTLITSNNNNTNPITIGARSSTAAGIRIVGNGTTSSQVVIGAGSTRLEVNGGGIIINTPLNMGYSLAPNNFGQIGYSLYVQFTNVTNIPTSGGIRNFAPYQFPSNTTVPGIKGTYRVNWLIGARAESTSKTITTFNFGISKAANNTFDSFQTHSTTNLRLAPTIPTLPSHASDATFQTNSSGIFYINANDFLFFNYQIEFNGGGGIALEGAAIITRIG